MDKIGKEYENETITISTGLYVCKKGNKLTMVNKGFCMGDLHYYDKKPKEPIPIGEIVTVNYCWKNFYVKYINVQYNGRNYDINPSDLK